MILCCGEALIDMIPEPTQSGASGFVAHSGGAVFNTAVALGRLGAPVGMLTGLSTDQFGQQLHQDLTRSNVDTSHVQHVDRPTTLAFVQLTDGHATYDFYDENTAGRMILPEDVPAIAPGIQALYFGGISLACEPCGVTYAHLLQAEGQDRVVMIDPNIRPSFIADEARFRARLAEMIAKSDIVKISDDDLQWLAGEDTPVEVAAEALLEQGPAVIILTRGKAGATGFMSGGQRVHAPAEQAKVADTVGAGDTFNAGVLAKLSELGLLSKAKLRAAAPEDLKDALQFGAKVAAVTVSRPGANPPWAHEL